jgi:bifunctional non-homologous end joining protein LigD
MLEEYNKKRNFVRTPEPRGDTKQPRENKSKFVVQKHDATRLHYDFRFEDKKERVLKSWAVPKGISLDPKVKRLAILTEDHPLDYLLFEGIIPEGSYGAGTVIVWDTGTLASEEDISDQFKKGKITFSLYGQKLKGKFKLIRIRSEEEENQWLLMKLADGLESEEDLTINRPESVLTGRTNDVIKIGENKEDKINRSRTRNVKSTIKKQLNEAQTTYASIITTVTSQQQQKEEFPNKVKPMLSTLVDKPFNSKDWAFEVKWDGVRSILFLHKKKGIIELQSRNGKSITHRYPELVKALGFTTPATSTSLIKCKESVVLDGEVVILDKKNGVPSFQSHQRRMNVDSIKEIDNLSNEIPATYYFFDILYLDGINLQGLSFVERRKILSDVIPKENASIKISHFIEEKGKEVFDKTKSMGLEGLVAKYKSSTYKQGIRSRDWLKIKHIKTQDCVVIGYIRGEGNRENYFGSLLLAAFDPQIDKFRFVGHTGSGFDFVQLDEIYKKLKAMQIDKCPIDYVPYTNRDPTWIRPELIAEIKFSDWTEEKIMRAPIFLRFREDKSPRDCFIEGEKPTNQVLEKPAKEEEESKKPKEENLVDNKNSRNNTYYSSSFSNLDKVFWDKTSDFIVFDLDTYIYSGKEGKGQEPEYNHNGFKAAVEVAYHLKDFFNDLRIESFIKTSGKTGLHIFVPIANLYTYEQTRSFSEVIGKILLRRYPEKITMEWDTTKRKGKVFFDHNQNARGKTIASVFSARPTKSATVSMPIRWNDLSKVLPIDYTILNVPDILNKKSADPWSNIQEKKQDLNKVLKNISEQL